MSLQRRDWLWAAGVAAVAAAGGAGVAVLRQRPQDSASSEAEVTFWRSRFDAPDGTSWSPADFAGRALIVNFWATWCPPCLREMPALERFQRAHGGRGWQVLGLAADKLPPVRDYLQRAPVSFPVGMIGLEGIELSRQLGNRAGGLPFTLVIDARGRVVERKMGETNDDQLSRWAAEKR